MAIHSTAVVSKESEIDPSATIGPYCVIKGRVKIGAGTILENHVSVGYDYGVVTIGKNNLILPYAAVGGPPQDSSYKNQEVRLEIGDRNIIREATTINLGTVKGGGLTKIGHDGMIMANSHIAHDCILGDRVIVANTQMAGHVIVQDDVRLGGGCLVNQFCVIGKFAYVAGDATINKDILPFTIVQGKYAAPRATNKVGLERAGYKKEEVDNINRAIRILLMGNRTVEEALAEIEKECENSENIMYLTQFIKKSERGIAR